MSQYSVLSRLLIQKKLHDSHGVIEGVLEDKLIYDYPSDLSKKYLLAGKYLLQGFAAEMLYKYKTGTGQQLQHMLGEVFSKKKLTNYARRQPVFQYLRKESKQLSSDHLSLIFLGVIQTHASDDEIRAYLLQNWLTTIPMKDADAKVKDVEVYDIAGKQITTEFDTSEHNLIIKTDQLPNGWYYVSILLHNGYVSTQKIIVQH